MSKIKAALEDQSTITIGLAVLMCGVVWRVAHLDSRVDQNALDIARVEARQVIYVETITKVANDIGLIKYRLKMMDVSMKKKNSKEIALGFGPENHCSILYHPNPVTMME